MATSRQQQKKKRTYQNNFPFKFSDEHNLPSLPSLPTIYQTPIHHQLPSANHSSSSADSLSPDYPDLAHRCFSTPVTGHKRPIVGRKIIGNTEQRLPLESPTYPVSSSFDSGFDSSPVKPRWLPEDVTPQRNYQRHPEQVTFILENIMNIVEKY